MPGYKLFVGNKCPGFYLDKYGTYVVCGKETITDHEYLLYKQQLTVDTSK